MYAMAGGHGCSSTLRRHPVRRTGHRNPPAPANNAPPAAPKPGARWSVPRSPCRRAVACAGFLGALFGGSKGEPAEEAELLEDYSQEELDEVVLTELMTADGAAARVVYRNGGEVDAAALEVLCNRVGWPRRPLHKVECALANSFLVSTLTLEPVDGSSSGGGSSGGGARLVGLARCTSDGAFNATIWDVLIDPDLQGRGLGKALVERVVRTLLKREITNVTLFADAKVVDFYKQLGFVADPEGIRGMFWIPRQ